MGQRSPRGNVPSSDPPGSLETMDPLMRATFVSTAFINHRSLKQLLLELIRGIQHLIHLRRHMKVSASRLQQLEARAQWIQQCMAPSSKSNLGQRIDKLR